QEQPVAAAEVQQPPSAGVGQHGAERLHGQHVPPAPLTRVASGQERAVPVRVELTEALWLDVRIAVQEAAPRAPYDAVRPAGRPLPPGRAEQRLDAAFAAQRAADVLLDLGGRHLRAVL